MKLRVCVEFIDKVTGETHRIGDVIEVAEERGAEILANPLNLAEAVEDPKPQKSASRSRKRGGAK